MAKQIDATGQAVAQLTLQQMKTQEEQPASPTSSEATLENPFQKGRPPDPRSSRAGFGRPPYKDHQSSRNFIPKLSCPRFDGQNPCIWKEKCQDYFQLLNVPESMWATVASLHMDGNAEKWAQIYKLKQGLGTWTQFMKAVQHKFGAFDYQHAIEELLELQQTGTVEEYVTAFEALQYQISMHDQGMGDTYFISQFVKGLKADIRYGVQGKAPDTMEKAVRLAKIQQTIQSKAKSKQWHSGGGTKSSGATSGKGDSLPSGGGQWTKERQLRDYCRTHNLCFFCREPFDATHAAKCTKRPKSQVNALVVNDLDVQLNDEVLAQLEMEDTLAQEFGTLSLNAISGTEVGEAFRLRALVKNKVMLILVDSGSSHSFISSNFLSAVGISSVSAEPKKVRVANGDIMISDQVVPALEWWVQGHTFSTDLRVLDFQAYDAILGYDWLKTHSPIIRDWEARTMEFSDKGKQIVLKGIPPPGLAVSALPVERMAKWLAGNDVWALAVVQAINPHQQEEAMIPEVQEVLEEFQDVFEEPQGLPPKRVYDHAIPIIPNTIPVNARPYTRARRIVARGGDRYPNFHRTP